jgi:nicotinamidase-related amidase
MRLPRDAALIVIDGAGAADVGRLLAVWREEKLPVIHCGEASAALPDEPVLPPAAPGAFDDAALDAMGATTLTFCGTGAALAASARAAAGLGYRVFVVSEGPMAAGPDVRVVALDTALAAGRMARVRERLKAARAR